MRSAAILCLAAGIASSTAFFLTPDVVHHLRSLDERIAALDPSERTQFFERQAELRRLVGDIDDIAANFRPEPSRTWATATDVEAAVDVERMVKRAPTKTERAVTCQPLTSTVPKSLQGKKWSTCLHTTDTKKIDDPVVGLQVNTTTSWAGGRTPPSLRGIFYMEGNPLPSECVSTATAFFNSSINQIEIPVWAPKAWSSSPNFFGWNEQEAQRSTGSTYRYQCAERYLPGLNATGLTTNGTVCRIVQYFSRDDTSLTAGAYWTVQVDPNYHIRVSQFKNITGPDGKFVSYNYNFWRIVDEQGQRTPYFYSRYLNTTNKKVGYKGQQNVHLVSTQLVPLRQ